MAAFKKAGYRIIESKGTGPKGADVSIRPADGMVKLVFNRSGQCLMCGHTPGREMPSGSCCACIDCRCCGVVPPQQREES